jgi:hypothetical protein
LRASNPLKASKGLERTTPPKSKKAARIDIDGIVGLQDADPEHPPVSDHQEGPGWWLASDGRWYPPDQAPAVPPADTWATPPAVGPPVTPPRGGMSSGGKMALAITGMVGVALLAVAAIFFLGQEDDEDDASGSTGSTTTTTSSGSGDDLPAGFALLEGDGVSIAAPEGWEHLDAEDLAMDSEEFAAAYPDAPEGMVEQGINVFEQGAVLVAFDLSGREAFASNVTIIDVPGEAPLGAIEGQASSELGTLGGEVLDSGLVDLPAGEALRIDYTLEVALPDGSAFPAEGVQLYVPLAGRTYIITVSAGEGAAALADEMIATFRVD